MAYPYLNKAVTKIDSDRGEGPLYEYAVANCQGWRVTQEDAHLAMPNFDHNTCLFGIFDGHNGPEVSDLIFILIYTIQFLISKHTHIIIIIIII